MKKPFELYLLYLILILLAINAFYGGGTLVISPDGSLLGIDKEWISGIPFQSYLFPGILLIIFMGFLPLVTLVGLIYRRQQKFFNGLNIYPEKHWSWTFSLYTGIITIIWIIFQQFLTQYFILQPIISAVGVLILILTLSPRIQLHYTE